MDFLNWKPTTTYFGRLETVSFFHLFIVRETWSTLAAVIQNTEAERLQYCPDCHHAQISLRKRRGWTCFSLWWKLKGLPYSVFEQKCSAASYRQLQLPLFFTFCDVNHQCQAMSEPCVEHSVVWRAVKCIALALNVPYQGKSTFVSMPKTLAWTQQQVDSV